ncbi:uncharacterized protein V2V93DRAFT_360549 [Kockiozyma suomiensis]|uniref:uncharacterized protein n=1 Tax=Kockiozyma suomiensis TaxID=1337062 RepID=UPI00334369DD
MPAISFSLTFLDIDPALVSAWSRLLSEQFPRSRLREELYPVVLESSLKNYKESFDCIVSPGNSFARMDGGFDLLISRFFSEQRAKMAGVEEKEVLRDMLKYVQDGHFRRWKGLQPVGSCYLIDMLPWMTETSSSAESEAEETEVVAWNRFRCRYVAHSPTMRVPSALWREEIVYDCMWSMLNEVYNHNEAIAADEQQEKNIKCGFKQQRIRKVVVSGLGTGTGGLDREVCAQLMVSAYVAFVSAVENGDANEWRWSTAQAWDKKISATAKK